jgi:hypothetical protein
MALSDSKTPSRETNFAGGPTIERLNPSTIIATAALSPLTLTVDQLMMKVIPVDCQGTCTLTLPSAAVIGTTYSGIFVGDVIEFIILNYGAATATIAVGTGITAKTITGVTTALGVASLKGCAFWLVCTGRQKFSDPQAGSWTFDLYGSGPTAAIAA